MNTGYVILGGAGYFVLDGTAYTVPAAGTSDRSHKPGATDTSWLNLDHIDIKLKNTTKIDEVMRPIPGKRVRYDVVELSRAIDADLHFFSLSNFVYQMLFGTAPLPNPGTVGGQYNPLVAKPCKGWLKLEQYNAADNTLLNTVDLYVYIEPPQQMDFAEKKVECDMTAKVLWSSLNTGLLN